MSATQPFPQTTTPNIERANRLISLKAHPGFFDLLALSQELVQSSADQCADYGGWDAQQIVVLKVRMQAAKEHHQLLISKILEAIRTGVDEQMAMSATLPEKTVGDVVEQGDYVRQQVLTKFDEFDTRPAGSF
jgi:hypothetical protein